MIRTRHEIRGPGGSRLRVVYRLEASGPDADQLGPAISADFPETIAGLLEYAGQRGGGRCRRLSRRIARIAAG